LGYIFAENKRKRYRMSTIIPALILVIPVTLADLTQSKTLIEHGRMLGKYNDNEKSGAW
jgi:hypothetical protein